MFSRTVNTASQERSPASSIVEGVRARVAASRVQDQYPTPKFLRELFKDYEVFRTFPYPGMTVPGAETIKERCKDIGITSVSNAFFRDLVNCAGGGGITSGKYQSKIIRETTASSLPKVSKKAELKKIKERIAYHEGICEFLESIPWRRIPGDCAIDKACIVLKMLQHLDAVPGNDSGMTLPIGFGKEGGEIDTLLEKLETFDTLDIELMSGSESSGGQEAGTRSHPGLKKRCQIAEKVLSDPTYSALAEISRRLDEFPQFNPTTLRDRRVTMSSPERITRPIRSLDEVSRMPSIHWSLYDAHRSLFLYRAASHQLTVTERVNEPLTQKQLLYLLIDSSGSMTKPDFKPVGAALAVLLNRLRAVSEGDAELYYRMFDIAAYEQNAVKNFSDAQRAMAALQENNFAGGDTKIAVALNTGVESIRKLVAQSHLRQPDLVLVTDGKDAVNLPPDFFNGIVLHLVLLNGSNPALEKLAEGTGGAVIKISF